jgi:two-component system, response regulator YesN
MMARSSRSPTGFPPDTLRALAAGFRADTGLPVVVADREGRELDAMGGCPLCARMKASRKREVLCRGHRATAIAEAYRWGEPCISLCPFGIVTFSVPLSHEGRLTGGIVSGFCIFPQMQDDIRGDVRERMRRLGVSSTIGPRTRLTLTTLSSEMLRQHARQLFELVAAGGLNDVERMAESRERGQQQFTIANYLEDARGARRDLVTSLVSIQNEIIDKVIVGDISGSREIINRFLGVIFLESGMNFDMLKVRLLELIIIISRAAIGKGISAEGLLGPRYSYLTDINAATGFDDLFWKVTKALENFTRAVSEERGRTARAHVTRMKEFLSRRFATKVTAREVAAAAGLSVSRALHLFRRETGVSLLAYVTALRIDYARYLLKNTERSMADIASECGFFDQSHFTKAFKTAEGVPPLRYRRAARGAT